MTSSTAIKKAVRIFLHRPDGMILVVTRAHRQGQGVYCMPGGKVDATDESLEAAICRETQEETGLMLDPTNLSVLFSAIAHDDKGDSSRDYEVVTFSAPWSEDMGTPSSMEKGVFPSWVWPETLQSHSMGGDYEVGVIAAWNERIAPSSVRSSQPARFS